MTWRNLQLDVLRTHHLCNGAPAYEMRFDEVLKFRPPGLAPVCRSKEAWHIHPDGSAAYSRRFRRTFGFYESLAAVMGEEGWFHIHTDGRDAYPRRFDWCGNYQGGRCTVREAAGAYLHIKPTGEPVYPERWHYAGDYRDCVAVVQADDGRSTHIDLDGHLLHRRWFTDLDVFHKGFARARDDNGWTHVNTAGVPAYSRRFASVEPFYNGQARVERFDGGLEVIDEQGEMCSELRPALCSEFAALSSDMVGFWRTQTIASAVELGVFEALPGTSAEVATRCSLWPERAHRLLQALAELSLLIPMDGTWDISERGRYLLADHPHTLVGAAPEYAQRLTRLWSLLPDALRIETGWQPPDFFQEIASDPDAGLAHHRTLQSYASHDYGSVPAALQLAGQERIVDAGGGLGTLANLIVDNYPSAHVTVMDRPEVIERANAIHHLKNGIEFRSGDLFEPWGVEADAVVLARVLHDWNDQDATRILSRARSTLSKNGRLFIVEMVLPESGAAGSLCDLHLLVVTGGQERTTQQFVALLKQTGFELAEVRRLPALPSVLVGVAK